MHSNFQIQTWICPCKHHFDAEYFPNLIETPFGSHCGPTFPFAMQFMNLPHQALLSKVKELGYWELYIGEDPAFKNVIHLYAAMPYVPLDKIHDVYAILSQHAQTLFPDNCPFGTRSITPFNNYFSRTWVGTPGSAGGLFKHCFWNVREA